jgi:zinc/manganese transport system permease protein
MQFLSEWRWMMAPLLACLILSITHVYFGIHVVSRKVIFVDLALAQIAALGATYATTLGYDANDAGDKVAVALFSLAFTFVGAGLFAIARMRKERVPQEAFIGITYAAASATAVLILSKSPTGGEELKHMLVGDVLLVSAQTIRFDAVLYSLVLLFHFIFRRKFFAISADADAAHSAGINIRLWDMLFYMSFGVLVTQSVAIAGVLLVFSYLVIPAVIAQMWNDTIRGRLLLGWFIAVTASVAGILWSFYSDYPTGPAVVMTLAAFLVISGAAYSIIKAEAPARAALSVGVMILIGFAFFATLAHFKKMNPAAASSGSRSPADVLLEELKDDDVAAQLDAVSHLSEMNDPRIVPALEELLARSTSEQVVEGIAEALEQKKDPKAAPALKAALARDFDPFLKLTLAKALVAINDKSGYAALLALLKNDEAGFARNQAIEVIKAKANTDFGYDAEKSAAENAAALQRVEDWIRRG